MRLSAIFCLLAAATTLACGASTPEQTRPQAVTPSTPAAVRDAGAATDTIRVRLLAFNDFHGNLKPPTGHVPKVDGPVGGAPYFAAHLRKLATGQPNTLIVAAGDLVGASPLASALFHDEPTVAVMNAVGLSVTTIGNHELDEGIDELLRLRKGGCHPKDGCKLEPSFTGARYEMLGANMTSTTGGAPPLPAYVVREVGGVPIAFVGMPLEGTPHALPPESVTGLTFADEVKTANALVPEIRAKGVETIVLLIHQGGETTSPGLDECNDLRGPIVKIVEDLDPAFDAVISGHTHQLYNCKIGGRPVTSTSSFGRVITALDLDIDPKTRDVVRTEAHNHAVTHDIAPDPVVQAIVDRAAAVAAPLENRVIGHIAETLTAAGRNGGESPLGSVVADAQLEATKKLGAKAALVNAGGIRTDIVFRTGKDAKDNGVVTYGEAFAAQPFGNRLVTLTITAAELATVLERSFKADGIWISNGLTVRVDSAANAGSGISLALDGKPLPPKANVRITTNSFLAERDPILRTGKDRVTGPIELDALEAYFAAHPVVSPPKKARILRAP
ncbi:MAG TPA: bifunctional metallophosphatase/5'-nucleotidase [Labilithrix sp.]|nr:bifunctional metallophosphatase/5'-nucleotidase [Labilithrix sp.]